MNFFNIGAGEFFLILIMALLVFGPQRLPEVARRAGKAVRDLRNMVKDLDPELLEDWREITRDLESVRDEMASLRSDVASIQRDLAGAARELSQSVDEAVETAKGSMAPSRATGVVASAQTLPAALAGGQSTAGATVPVSAKSASATDSQVGPAPVSTPSPRPEAEGEIVGKPLPLRTDGSVPPDEILGEKIYPLPHSAARPLASDHSNGRPEGTCYRSREALMAVLAQRRAVRHQVPQRTGVQGGRRLPAAPRRVKRG